MNTPVQETQKTHEQTINPDDVLRWLTYAGNDERKLLILLALNEADQPLGQTALYRFLEARAGTEGIQGALKGPFQFCEQSLASVGAVEPTQTEVLRLGKYPENASAFQITPDGKEFGVPFAGALLQWSLDHPEVSLGLLGQTAGKFEARAPLVRFWALYDLVTTPDDPKSPSISYLAQHLEIDDGTRTQTAERLKQLGLVSKEGAHTENKRQFRVIQPDYITGERKKPFENLKPETQAIFNGFKEAYKIKDTWQKDEFLKLVSDMQPEVNPKLMTKIRIVLDHALAPSTSALKGVVEVIGGRQYDAYSKVSIKPEAARSIKELVGIVDGFYSGDVEQLEQGKARAAAIISSPDNVAELYKKAFERSTLANTDEAFESRLVNIVRSAGGTVTASTVRSLYAESTGRNLSNGAINVGLEYLANKGELNVSVAPKSKIKQQSVKRYSLA